MPTAPTIVDTPVRITVHPPVTGGRYVLSYFPRRWEDNTIYFTPPEGQRNPNLPREVRWEVDGLLPGQELEIREKATSDSKGRILGHPFRLTPSQNICHSGEAAPGPNPRPRVASWSYDIILKDASGQLARIDPDIILKEDP